MSRTIKGIVAAMVFGLIAGAFLGSVFLGSVFFPHESFITVTSTEYITSYASTITVTPTFTVSKEFTAPSVASFNVRNCSTLRNFFSEFKNPIIVANYGYYIYRLPTQNLSWPLPNFNETATRILTNTVVRTQSFPIFQQTTYFWSASRNSLDWNWKNC